MNPLRSAMAHSYPAAFRLLRGLGLDAQLKRDTAMRVVGMQSLWARDDPLIARGAIVEHRIDGRDVRFFVADENDIIQQCHVMGAFYEPAELGLMREYLRPGVFVDIGANVGNHSLFALLMLGAPWVIAFEPNPVAFRLLRYNMLLNALMPRVDLRMVGLSDISGPAQIARSPDRNLGATRLESGEGPLALVRGDDALAGEAISFLKIDVEQLEMRVLAGLRGVIATCRPVIMIEVDDANAAEYASFVGQIGYRTIATIASHENSNHLIVPR